MTRLVPALLAVTGLAATGALFWSFRAREIEGSEAELAVDVNQRVAVFHRELDSNLARVEATYALFKSSNTVEPGEFQTFTKVVLKDVSALRALVWIEGSGEGGGAPFHVVHRRGPEAASLGITSELRDALQEAVVNDGGRGELVTFTIPPGSRSDHRPRVLAAKPFRGKAGSGLVAGLLDVERLLVAEHPPDFAFLVQDVTRLPASTVGGNATGEELERAEQEFSVGLHVWRISYTTPSALADSGTGWGPWVALLLGLVATGLLVATVASVTSRGRIQRLVGRRTREIMAAYETLSAEAQQRQEAVKEKDRLEQRMRAIIDLVPDMIYVKDWFGRYMLANKATADFYGTTVAALTASRNVDMNADPADPDETLKAERLLLEAGLSSVIKAIPLVDSEGRRRIHHQVKIPCTIFGDGKRTLLCISADITDQRYAEDSLRSQNRILAQLARGEDPKKVLASLTGMAEEIVPGMRCSVLVVGPERRHLHHCAAPSLPAFYNEAVDGLEIGPGAGSCGAAAHSGSRMVVEDVMTHPNWEPYRDLAHRAHIRACWSEPIRSADGEVLGTFAMYYSVPRAPEPHEEELIEAMANLAGIAIERGRLQASS